MKISIAGSWKEDDIRKWGLQGSYEHFQEACRLLGESIASEIEDAIIMVYSDDHRTIDFQVVQGIITAIENRRVKNIQIKIVKSPEDTPYENLAKRHYRFFSYESSDELLMTSRHFNSLAAADIVITMGGGNTTFLTGSAAILSNKRLLPIGSFGGASGKILDRVLDSLPEDEMKNNLRVLTNPWSRELVQYVLRIVKDFPKILIVHGRSRDYNDLVKHPENVERLPAPILMKRIFGEGRTLPEKFEDLASSVHCAIVVATPDDEGGLNRDRTLSETALHSYSPRARQNVWLETGWFWGSVGRKRVMILIKENEDGTLLELPSDISGIEVYSYKQNPVERRREISKFIEGIRNSRSI